MSSTLAELTRAPGLCRYRVVACERCRNNVIDGESSRAFDEPADSQRHRQPNFRYLAGALKFTFRKFSRRHVVVARSNCFVGQKPPKCGAMRRKFLQSCAFEMSFVA